MLFDLLVTIEAALSTWLFTAMPKVMKTTGRFNYIRRFQTNVNNWENVKFMKNAKYYPVLDLRKKMAE